MDDNDDLDINEKRALDFLIKHGFDFSEDKRKEIIKLLNDEFDNYIVASSEYLRVLCGYLFCIGNIEDLELIKKIKYKINIDVGCMIDYDWIESLETNALDSRDDLIKQYVSYYKHYFELDNLRGCFYE